jgi:ABC-type amino acid transport substrate-binding protein
MIDANRELKMAKNRVAQWKAGLASMGVAILSALSASGAAAGDYKLIEPGTIAVAITGDMPGLVVQGDKLVGYDGEILQTAADNLGLKIKPVTIEWSGAIAAVQSGRVDLIGGLVAWTPKRALAMAMTDPTGYVQSAITQKNTTNWNTVASLEGKKVGSITGFSFVPDLRKIPGIELTLYDNQDAALRDLMAGRVEAILGDSPVMDYGILRNPDWGLKNLPILETNPDYPLLTGTTQYVFGLNKDNAALADALSGEIRKLWASCKVKEIGKKYGLVSDGSYTPPPANYRVGVDRPEGWQAPKC